MDDAPDRWRFTAPLWLWQGEGAWHFVTVPEDVSDEVDFVTSGRPRAGFGSVRVEVTVGTTVWRTSLFPSKEHGAYVLPIKKAVRRAEGLDLDAPVDVGIRLVET